MYFGDGGSDCCGGCRGDTDCSGRGDTDCGGCRGDTDCGGCRGDTDCGGCRGDTDCGGCRGDTDFCDGCEERYNFTLKLYISF